MTMTQFEINSLLSMITVKLNSSNFIKWSYQVQSVLEVNDLFSYLDGSYPCPPKFALSLEGSVTDEITDAYKEWKVVDKALIGLLMAALDDDVMDIMVGSRSSREAWLALQEMFSSVSRASIMQLKTDLQTIKKGSDSVDKYLLRIKHAKDQLNSVGVPMQEEDIVVVVLNGLPDEFAMIRTVIRARENPISLKELRSHLLAAERDIETQFVPHNSMTAMAASDSTGSYNSGGYMLNSHGVSSFDSDKGKGVWNGKSSNWSISKSSDHSGDDAYKSFHPVTCQICNKKGHTALICSVRTEGSSSQSIVICQICGSKGHAALDCTHRSCYAYQGSDPPVSLIAFSAHSNGVSSSHNHDVWIG